ncbi:disulfide bond formation protein B [Telmatospirillum siberiense]|uniref:Disulfide bond formation protein B n=1 Tax=Telmatospirillum siberiense TaxID=382514 RepID=A0A2N3PQU7_9PROT|nr:disulfide bond formation protein B [Telmatospirillum siberiense]PKU22783.1 disulfide bond formation protein B [Telmatospirillum siberiense]
MMTFPVRLFPSLLLLACVGAMGTALITQYGFGLEPCILCFYQRIPYVVAGVLAVIALSSKVPVRGKIVLIALCALAFAIDSGIAFYHVGVEHHWWESACVGGVNPEANSAEALKALLAGPPPVPCDRIPWSVFGISMAGYNALFTCGLAVFSVWAARTLKRQA